jgi:hypothetical protein
LRRLEEVREEMRRQHAAHITELLQALEQTWNVIDALRPPGADGNVDMLRATQAHLRHRDLAGGNEWPHSRKRGDRVELSKTGAEQLSRLPCWSRRNRPAP